jgi:hypothetical protein
MFSQRSLFLPARRFVADRRRDYPRRFVRHAQQRDGKRDGGLIAWTPAAQLILLDLFRWWNSRADSVPAIAIDLPLQAIAARSACFDPA